MCIGSQAITKHISYYDYLDIDPRIILWRKLRNIDNEIYLNKINIIPSFLMIDLTTS